MNTILDSASSVHPSHKFLVYPLKDCNHRGGSIMRSLRVIMFAVAFSWGPVAKADLGEKLSTLVGYVIVDAKTIKAWYDEGDGEKGEGSFKGCKHGRIIVFTDDKILKCAGYGYQYAYRPTAVILVKSISFKGGTVYDYKMVVEDEVYDMRR